MSLEVTKDYLKNLEDAIENKQDSAIREMLEGLHAADISMILDQMEAEQCRYVLSLLNRQIGADIITNLEEDTQEDFLKVFNSKELAEFMDLSDSDDAADILNEQPVKVREEVLAGMQNKEKTAYIRDLLKYDEDCAGGLMAKELIRANINWTVKQTIEEIRRQTRNVDKILTVYVVDNQNALMGRISLKKIILTKDDTEIKDIYIPDILSVQTYYDKEEVAEIMQKYDLEAIPVVNVQGKLLGRITIDDIIDVITETAEVNQQIMSGISENVEEDDNVWMLSRARLPWLLVGMLGGLIGAQFIGLFENDLKLVPAMAFFIPLITATGGNVGIQSSTIVVQALANSAGIFTSSASERLIKVLFVALINGVVISTVVFVFNVFFADIQMAMVVALALFAVVLLASFMGTITPILLDKMGINPALASGPFITTANDLLGLAVYFMVARLLFNVI
ncbi:MAG: magnesium transporter [Flammeovirgaceae bacterium]|nr:magnesium transporter [Flammeovirgaceae bacterium]